MVWKSTQKRAWNNYKNVNVRSQQSRVQILNTNASPQWQHRLDNTETDALLSNWSDDIDILAEYTAARCSIYLLRTLWPGVRYTCWVHCGPVFDILAEYTATRCTIYLLSTLRPGVRYTHRQAVNTCPRIWFVLINSQYNFLSTNDWTGSGKCFCPQKCVTGTQTFPRHRCRFTWRLPQDQLE